VPSPGLEVHLDAFEVGNASASQRYLITSPEYQLKRLIAGGIDRLYALGKVFRRGERGAHHNPEFTMLEWYATGWDWQTLASSVEKLTAGAARALRGEPTLRFGARTIDLRPPWPRRSVRELFAEIGVDLRGDESADVLRQKLAAKGYALPSSRAWDDSFFTVFLDHIEPCLAAASQPTIVYDWPVPLCALAQPSPADARVVERFEAYVPANDGVLELCNGFGELTDVAEQRARLQRDLDERRRRDLPAYPIDERFLAAVGELPRCAGVALGMDRLAMILLGADDIGEVLPFPVDEL
jgi:lysyl-tRNA synthetase class 2